MRPRTHNQRARINKPLAVVAAFTLAVTSLIGLSQTPTSAEAATAPLVSDNFARTAASGWGTATSGQKYTVSPAKAHSVSSGAGLIKLTPGLTTTATVAATATDATLAATYAVEKVTTGGSGVTTSVMQRVNGKYSYQARTRLASDGRLSLWISRYDGSTSKEVVLAPAKVVATGVTGGKKINVEFSVSGTSPVSVKASAWIAGTTKPAWQRTGSDSSSARLTARGQASVAGYLSGSSPSTNVRFSALTVTPTSATPAPTPTPSATPKPTATPTPKPTPTPTSTTAPTTSRGSATVGSTRYTVPSGAVYVAAKGTKTGAGTSGNPYGSAQHAIDKARSGSTLVLRGGTYRESIMVPSGKTLTIQSYPGEAVWFDGADTVTGFTKSGPTWVKTGWNHIFDSKVSFSAGKDESSRFVDPAYPMAGHPDQVWVGGSKLRQVSSAGAVKSGTFFVDRSGKRLIIGTDPTGKKVEASTRQKAIKVHGVNTTLRGFGVKRYATTLAQMGAVSTEVKGATLENLVVTQNATVGVYAWNNGHKFRNLSVTENGLMGLGANGANDMSITGSDFSRNNAEQFKWAPASGGIKITKSERVRIANNSFLDNKSIGLWLDVSSYDVDIVGNVVAGNPRYGIHFELSAEGVIADNYVYNNGRGIAIFNSASLDIWNNTVVGNNRTLEFLQDERRQEVSSLASRITWVTKDISIKNNLLSYGADACPILTQDLTKRWTGNQFGLTFDANLYHRSSTSKPSNLVCWANGSSGTQSFKTLDAFRKHTGHDKNSATIEGTGVTSSTYAATSKATGAPGLKPQSLPAALASPIGVATGTAKLGALSSHR